MGNEATLVGSLVGHKTEAAALSLFIAHNTSTAKSELEHKRPPLLYLPDDLSKLGTMTSVSRRVPYQRKGGVPDGSV